MSSAIIAIAAHPGDALFTMGAAVAQHVQGGGQGIFLSLSLGERGSPTIAPPAYGAMQRAATEKAAAMLGAQAAFLSYPDDVRRQLARQAFEAGVKDGVEDNAVAVLMVLVPTPAPVGDDNGGLETPYDVAHNQAGFVAQWNFGVL